jgi:hypothetical protein
LPKYPGWLKSKLNSYRDKLFVKVDAVVVLTTSVTTTAGMLAVLANATVTEGDLTLK